MANITTEAERGIEEELWGLLERCLTAPDEITDHEKFKISGWSPQLLYFPEEKIGHSVRPALARAVTEFHASISKAYAMAIYGRPNRLLLRKEDRDALDLIFVVTDGSNGLEALADAIENLTESMVSKMTGKQITGVIVVLILLYFGVDTAKYVYASNLELKAAKIASEERISLSEQETQRMQLLKDAMDKFGIDPTMVDEAEEGLKALTRPATQENMTRIRGVNLNKRQANAILSADEKEKEGRRLDGDYRVVDINTETEDGFFVRLQDVETNQEIPAYANYSELTQEDIHTIFAVAEEKSMLHALVNAFFVGEKITKAYIVRADRLVNSQSTANEGDENLDSGGDG